MTETTQATQQQLLDSYRGKVTEDQLLDALSDTISKLECDPVISRKAYRMRLENLIESDEYNPNGRGRGQHFGRCTNDRWVNVIPKHTMPTLLMIVSDVFEMLESGTGVDELNINRLRNRITELFINLRQFNLDHEHYNKIHHYILKTLDSYDQVDLMLKVSNFES